MYAVWHIRPHSLFAGPSLSLTLWPPKLSLDGPTCLPAAFAAGLWYLCDLFTFARAGPDWVVAGIHLPDVIQVTSIDSSLIEGHWIWPFSTSCYWDSYYNGTASEVLLVDIVDVYIGRSCRLTRSRRARHLPRGSDCRPSLLIKRDIGTVSALSNKRSSTFSPPPSTPPSPPSSAPSSSPLDLPYCRRSTLRCWYLRCYL